MSTVQLIGKPDGPMKFVPEIGYEVGTFTNRHEELEPGRKFGALACIMHHVPTNMRGPYAPEQLANYSPRKKYTTNFQGLVICGATNKKARKIDPKTCQRRAMNRTPFCEVHGGRLHPYDRRPERQLDVSKMSRWEMLVNGVIGVEDLDDEELMRGMCRRPNGSFPERAGGVIPRHIYDKMVSRLFDRAQEMFRQNLFTAVDCLGEIVKGSAYEPADRLRAADMIINRVLGKAAEKVDVTVGTKPYEQIIAGFARTTRAETEAAAEITSGTTEAEVVDAEVVETEEDSWSTYSEEPLPKSSEAMPAGSSENRPARMARRRVTPPSLADTMTSRREIVETREEQQQVVKDARARRYAARYQGRTDTTDLAYIGTNEPELDDDGLPIDGKVRRKWTDPNCIVVPTATKAKETRRRNAERFR